MALHKDFPKNPYAILDPSIRWFPADEALREKGFDKLIPPLVADLRKRVKEWWCEDVNNRQNRVVYKALCIKQEEWEKDKLKNFDEAVRVFNLK